MRVYRYPLSPMLKQTLSIPEPANILSTGVQDDTINIWVMVDPSKPTIERTIEVFLPGVEIVDDMGIERKFIGTCIIPQHDTRDLVFHIFERLT